MTPGMYENVLADITGLVLPFTFAENGMRFGSARDVESEVPVRHGD